MFKGIPKRKPHWACSGHEHHPNIQEKKGAGTHTHTHNKGPPPSVLEAFCCLVFKLLSSTTRWPAADVFVFFLFFLQVFVSQSFPSGTSEGPVSSDRPTNTTHFGLLQGDPSRLKTYSLDFQRPWRWSFTSNTAGLSSLVTSFPVFLLFRLGVPQNNQKQRVENTPLYSATMPLRNSW